MKMRLVFFVPALLAINGCSSYKYQQAKGNYSEMWNRGYAEQPLEATNSWRVRYSYEPVATMTHDNTIPPKSFCFGGLRSSA
jgi:hypothetical protein